MAKKAVLDKSLGQEISDPTERINFLRANADGIETLDYMKRFDPETITQLKNDLSDTSIIINDLEIEKKEATAAFSEQLKPLIIEKKKLLLNIKQKAEMVSEKCFKFLNEELRMACFYNSEGDLVSSRPMTQEEYQKTMQFPERQAV